MTKYGFFHSAYQMIARPLFFLIPPENIHDFFLLFGNLIGKCICAKTLLSFLFSYQDVRLEQTVAGIFFRNPVGLSEGYDKDAQLLAILPSIGFGFTQVGTVTKIPYKGNPKPRLTRLPKSKGILVNYGLKNIGVTNIIKKLKGYGKISIPYSVSIGKTNSCDTVETGDGVEDYVACYKQLIDANMGDFYTINISCPNTFGGEPFTSPDKLDLLLRAMMPLQHSKPVLLKMPINQNWEETYKLLDVAVSNRVTGVIFGNLNKNFKDPGVLDVIPENAKGGIGGRPTFDLSNELISQTHKKYGEKLLIIGVGGIFSPEDAYEKIKRGASLVQLITGLVYSGPQFVGEINDGLTKLLEKDGYTSITQAIGAYNVRS